MATMLNPCAEADCLDPITTLLPADPFTSLRYHFGMLLGVDDLDTEKAYHLGKMRLHNAWLHGEGIVWGLAVGLDTNAGELEVLPGLALDAAGRELYLAAKACLSVPEWFDAHRQDADLVVTEADNSMTFDGHVVIRFRACLSRQVPAFADACNGSDTSTAYSRIEERVDLFLRPGLALVERPGAHRLRLLFRLDAPDEENGAVVDGDRAVLDARAAIDALAPADRPAAYRAAFVQFAALDEIDRQPALGPDEEGSLLFPASDDCEVVLADLHDVTLRRADDSWRLVGGTVDPSVRPSHVPTRTIQELTCGPSCQGEAAADSGPRVDPAAVTQNGTAVTIPVTAPLSAASVVPAAFSVSTFAAAGWTVVAVQGAQYDDPTTTITLTLAAAPVGDVLRIIARGTGDSPLLGSDLVPLAGAIGGPPGTADDGHDFVLMKRS